jgi:hypothetical protein
MLLATVVVTVGVDAVATAVVLVVEAAVLAVARLTELQAKETIATGLEVKVTFWVPDSLAPAVL